MHLGPIV